MKKYLKITGNEIITVENRNNADLFTNWFTDNYLSIRNQLIQKHSLNEDVLHDIYLSIHKRILYGGFILTDNIMPYFMCAYYTQKLKQKVSANRMQLVEASFFEYLKIADKSVDDIEKQQNESSLFQDIIEYIKKEHSDHYNLFYSNMIADKKMSCEKLSKQEGLSQYSIGVKLRNIKRELKENSDFSRKRKAII